MSDTSPALRGRAFLLHKGQPAWPCYDTSKRAVMLLNTSCTIAYDPDAETRKLWQWLDHI